VIKAKRSAEKQSVYLLLQRSINMAVSYKKLWKLLIDKDIKKKDLSPLAGISPATITKMGKGGHVTTEVLVKICNALNCNVDDILEFIPSVEK
jgi:DNA-binding Xre family transcriptional regulator